jgi:hypothetical protein
MAAVGKSEGTAKTPFKASEGDRFGYLRESKDSTSGELQRAKGTRALIGSKVRLEAFPNGLSLAV